VNNGRTIEHAHGCYVERDMMRKTKIVTKTFSVDGAQLWPKQQLSNFVCQFIWWIKKIAMQNGWMVQEILKGLYKTCIVHVN